jgi:hypothetical protein
MLFGFRNRGNNRYVMINIIFNKIRQLMMKFKSNKNYKEMIENDEVI